MSKTEEYSQKLKAELKDIEAEMKHLEADIERAKADGKNDLDEFRREVSAQYEKSRFEMEKLRASGEASLEQVKGALLDYCNEQGVESVRTGEGLVYRTTKVRYWTSDWESMNQFILEQNVPEFYEKRLNQGAVKDFLAENPETVPPGLNSNTEYTLTVRKK